VEDADLAAAEHDVHVFPEQLTVTGPLAHLGKRRSAIVQRKGCHLVALELS
jgi:hypothetical protein